MSVSDYTRTWYISESDTTLIAADDELTVLGQGRENDVSFECSSTDPATVERWEAITDGTWQSGGGEAGYLSATIEENGQKYAVVATHQSGDPNRIYLMFVLIGGGGAPFMSGGGGSSSGADQPPH